MNHLLRRIASACLITAGIAALLLTGATAQDVVPAPAPDSTLDITALVNSGFEFLATVLLALAGWVAWKIKQSTGIDIDIKNGGLLDVAIRNGIAYAKNFVLGADGKMTLDVKNELVRVVAKYVTESVPGVLDHFGITPQRLRDLIIARLPTS
jgi:hypothetical protein